MRVAIRFRFATSRAQTQRLSTVAMTQAKQRNQQGYLHYAAFHFVKAAHTGFNCSDDFLTFRFSRAFLDDPGESIMDRIVDVRATRVTR